MTAAETVGFERFVAAAISGRVIGPLRKIVSSTACSPSSRRRLSRESPVPRAYPSSWLGGSIDVRALYEYSRALPRRYGHEMADKAGFLHKQSTFTVIGCVQADVVMQPVTDLPAPGGTLLTEHMTTRVGGAGANAALAALEAGIQVRLIGCIGDDRLGSWMQGELAAGGPAGGLVVVGGETTGLTVALESPARDRSFLTYLGVNAHW